MNETDATATGTADQRSAEEDSADENLAEENLAGQPDGRSRRRERNVEGALDAVLDLAIDGVLDPSWEEVADRAGVSNRSLYRYFESRASLLQAAVERALVRVAPLLEVPDLGVGPLEHRISALVKARTDTYWAFRPVARAAYRRVGDDVVRDGLERIGHELCTQMIGQFAPELSMLNHSEQERTVALLDLAFQFAALEYLAGPKALDAPALVDALETHLRLHLEPLARRRLAHG